MEKFRLGVGPMSIDIIDLLIEYSDAYSFPIMFVASRNQVDYNSGYVCTTSQLVKQIKDHPLYDKESMLICRDHCGPYFSDLDKSLSLNDAIERCKTTIKTDIELGFDLIHIDVSKIKFNQLSYAKDLIEHAISQNPSIMLEFGSEENDSPSILESTSRLIKQLEFASAYKNIKYIVTKSGSLTKHTQVGNFDTSFNKTVASKIHDYGFLFKEHNADYLSEADVNQRLLAGIDALNIAPQLGSKQTEVTCQFGKKYPEYKTFYDHVLDKGYWKRWVTPDVTDTDVFVNAGGHYSFNDLPYKQLYSIVNSLAFKIKLKNEIFTLLDCYRRGMNENVVQQH